MQITLRFARRGFVNDMDGLARHFPRRLMTEASKEALRFVERAVRNNLDVVYQVYRPETGAARPGDPRGVGRGNFARLRPGAFRPGARDRRTYAYRRGFAFAAEGSGREAKVRVVNNAARERGRNPGYRYPGRVELGQGGPRAYASAQRLAEDVARRLGRARRINVNKLVYGTDDDYGWGRMAPRPLMTAALWVTNNHLLYAELPRLSSAYFDAQRGKKTEQVVRLGRL